MLHRLVPLANEGDTRSYLLDKFLILLNTDPVFNEIFTADEIRSAIHSRFGITVDFSSLNDLSRCFDGAADRARINKGQILIDEIEKQLTSSISSHMLDDDIKEEIDRHLTAIHEDLESAGFLAGQTDGEEEVF